ncbi:hypothetical protein DFJ58DRAFT_810379 [Suillus subalutaceus]|uniref:uncharacterized protein n=1 Tax=Suillus subalutaceus TaxID=48586 RepID=UPI001B85E7AB|nr:uncharacterized protein DFJ58DRAFT_810379 [Suillus subalutaceus]KAG1840463.1 hypothetical protein DFJ58DRAFT_810379 [Suillus subalutaceus]
MNELQDTPTAGPQYFYRVFDEKSFSQFHETSGFVAGIPNAIYDPKHWKARHELERHMDWTNKHPTPFISVTASREKALEFALQRVKSRGALSQLRRSTVRDSKQQSTRCAFLLNKQAQI